MTPHFMFEEIFGFTKKSMSTFRQYEHIEVLIRSNQSIYQPQSMSRIYSLIYCTSE